MHGGADRDRKDAQADRGILAGAFLWRATGGGKGRCGGVVIEGSLCVDQIKALVKEKGIEYFFCSFVELSGAPKAKLVPATHVEDMIARGRGLRRIRRRRPESGTARSRHREHAGFQLAHGAAVAQERRLGARQSPRQRPAVAVLPAHHSDAAARAARKKGYVFHVGVEPEFMLLKKNAQGRVRTLGCARQRPPSLAMTCARSTAIWT